MMKKVSGVGKLFRRHAWLAVLSFAAVAGAGAGAYAQCPIADNISWARGSTVRYFFDAGLSEEQKRQVRWAFAEWSRANSTNNARVRFEEVSSGGNFRVTLGSLPPGAPAFAQKFFGSDVTVTSAVLTIDPNNVYPGTNILIVNPSLPGYETAIIKLALHEIGHTMGLDHPSNTAACQQTPGATVMNYVCNENDARNAIPTRIAECDQSVLNSMPRYARFNQFPNPIDETNTFVRQQYLDFFNREPDQAGFAFWTNQINECGADASCRDLRRTNVSAAFFVSPEFQETGYFVYRVYQVAFGDISLARPVPLTIQEFLPEQQQVSRGVVGGAPGSEQLLEQNKQAWLAEFVTRSRFAARHAAASNETFVDTMNANAGGVLSTTERNSLVTRLNGGLISRAQALREVAEDQDLRAREFNPAFVLMEYFGYLRRNPEDPPEPTRDFAGYNFWLAKLNQFGGNYIAAEMVRSFIVSTEYRARFGQP